MHASRVRSSFIAAAAALLCSATVSASPALRRAETGSSSSTTSLSTSTSATASTTASVTAADGVAATSSSTSSSVSPVVITSNPSITEPTATTSSVVLPTETLAGGSFEVCHNANGPFAPFCKPDNGSVVLVGQSYYVTWDTSFFAAYENSTVLIQANYVDPAGGGPQAFQSAVTQNENGFISWTISADWLRGQSSDNITLYIAPFNPTADEPRSVAGPTVMVSRELPYQQPTTPVPRGASLYIALPTVFGFILLCVCGGYVINRKHRRIGLGNVMGRRNGYGVGKSRAQRLRASRKEGAIRLRDQELTAGGQYRDAPEESAAAAAKEGGAGHARDDSDALGSLAGTPTEDRTGYFRDEMRRQGQTRL